MQKDTLDSIRQISIFELRRQGYLKPTLFGASGTVNWSMNGYPTARINFELRLKGDNESFRPYIQLKYKIKQFYGESWTVYDDKFELIKVPCPFGGFRWFFKCGYTNGKYCGKRVAILYKVSVCFVCRHCAKLSYESCNENKKYRGTLLGISLGKTIESNYKLKRYYYRGKPTRKRRRYLKKMKKHMRKAISMKKKRAY